MIWLGIALVVAGIWRLLCNADRREGPCLMAIGAIFCVIAVVPAHSRDLGQWEGNDPAIRQWFKSLMQPDNPSLSCCGEADGYWCDDYYARDGKAFCKITDNRDDEPLRRPHVPVGTEIEIPNHKLKFDRANPTGHAVVFLAASGSWIGIEQSRTVYCFVQNSGV